MEEIEFHIDEHKLIKMVCIKTDITDFNIYDMVTWDIVSLVKSNNILTLGKVYTIELLSPLVRSFIGDDGLGYLFFIEKNECNNFISLEDWRSSRIKSIGI